ncbi:MAG: mechanosensitive ion channel, partial [Desulfobacteraceae bacterium]
TIAATVVVIAAAMVIATKEFLLNILGFLYLESIKFISVGDRIEVDQTRGDVIDLNLLGVTMLEIGSGEKTNQYTGLTVYVPNVKFLSTQIRNETYLWEDYVFHLITIPISNDKHWEDSEKALLQAANEVCEPYIKIATTSMKSLSRRHSLDEPSVNPRIHVQVASTDTINLILRIPVPTRRRGRLEQTVTRRYLQILNEMKMAK